MSDMLMMVVGVGSCVITALWLRVRNLEEQVDKDHRYFEWWMRSMENRKVDREAWDDEEEAWSETDAG